MTLEIVIGLALLVALVIIGVALVQVRDLFAAAMLMGFFSLLAAAYYVVVDAVDVAFTEAAVGAGLSTVLMVGALSLTTREEKRPLQFNPTALLIVISAGGLLIFGLSDVPGFGDPSAPIHTEHSPSYRYIHDSGTEVGVPNIVTSVLASYRGYDTFGETTVVFTAGLAVFLLLAVYRQSREPHEG